MRAVGLEPTRAQGPTDFKSGMSTIPSRPHLALLFKFMSMARLWTPNNRMIATCCFVFISQHRYKVFSRRLSANLLRHQTRPRNPIIFCRKLLTLYTHWHNPFSRGRTFHAPLQERQGIPLKTLLKASTAQCRLPLTEATFNRTTATGNMVSSAP